MSMRVLAAAALSGMIAAPAMAADAPKEKAPLSAAVVPAPSFFLFSDTQVSYTFADNTKEPGIPGTKGNPFNGRGIPKSIYTVSHADAWAYGTNFFTVDILKSGSQDPSGRPFPTFASTGVGATEVYGLYRGTLSGNALTNSKAFVIPGLVKDISLSYGADFNTKNTSFGSEKRFAVGGLNFAFDVPAGFFNVAVHASKEYNRNGIVPLPARDTEFNVTPEFEIVYNIPLSFTNLPLSLVGFNNIVLPKGRDGFNNQTRTEWLSRTNLVLDVGKLVYDTPNRVDAFVGFQYWYNKFGNDHRITPGSVETSFRAGFSIHVL